MTTTGCPDEESLVAMVEGALDEASLREIEAHVDRCERCAAVIGGLGALDSAAARPRVVGRYQLDRRIATGGMGEVWAAWDPQLRREIAVKLVRPERADEGRERERLLREARALARLGHPNVLAVHDVGEIDGEVFIATELVVGDTLASRGGPTSDWRALARLYTQAARGLAAAHAVGLVHRDVKPANLLLGADGRVRVADFGLAVRSRDKPSPVAETDLAASDTVVSVTATGHIAGTPAYMAPEQRAGQPADARVDQFALCVALAEGISGRRPAAGLDREALIALVTERRTRERDLDRLCAVIAKGLARDPAARHTDTNALADAIDAVVASSSGSIQPIPLTRSAPRPTPVRRHAGSVAVIAVAASLGVAAVLIVSRVAGGVASGSSAPQAEVGSADGAGSAGPSPAGPTVSVSPIGSGEDAATGSAAPAAGSGAPPAPAVRPPASRPAATNVNLDVNEALAAARRALTRHDPRACHAALANLPAVPAQTQHHIELARAMCEMASGRCEQGLARARKARVGMGFPASYADDLPHMYCPITGDLDTRIKRLITQVHAQKTLAWCRPYVAAARTAGREATTPDQRTGAATVLRQLARCLDGARQCDEAHALWKTAFDLDEAPTPMDLPNCPGGAPAAPSASAPAAPTAADMMALTATLSDAQQAVRRHDPRGCTAILAKLPKVIPAGAEQSVDIVRGICEMLAGDCAGGRARLMRAYAGVSVVAATVQSNAEIYCPITGDLETRLRMLIAKINAFSDRGSHNVRWCTTLLAPARAAASEATTAHHRSRAGLALARLATCIGSSGRCDEARALWDRAVEVEPALANKTPDLSPQCP